MLMPNISLRVTECKYQKMLLLVKELGPGSEIDIATGYGLDGREIESRWVSRFSAPVQTGPGTHPASCTMGTGFFLGVKRCRGVTLTPQPLLVPWSRKIRAIPVLPLCTVRPVQSLSACTVQGCTLHFYVVKERWQKHAASSHRMLVLNTSLQITET